MDVRIKVITVQATERDRDAIRAEAKRFGMKRPAILAAMVRLWESASDSEKTAVIGHPLVGGAA
jgi:hypothetical protein